jgi:tetratricopeptide (TPR) repeat protein
MPENPRLEELRRRVQADPASIAFAALAEEYRRIGHYDQAIETCRVGLQRHPAYLSARVTLGRALIELGEYDAAREELETVLRSAPENLAAIRGLAQIHERLGHDAEMHPSLVELANEPMPVQVVRQPEPPPPPPPPPSPPVPEPEPAAAVSFEPPPVESVPDLMFDAAAVPPPVEEIQPFEAQQIQGFDVAPRVPAGESAAVEIEDPATAFAAPVQEPDLDVESEAEPDAATLATLARLEQFLGAIAHARTTSANL